MAPLKYLNVYHKLPASAPTGHPHILSKGFDEDTDQTNLRAADGVATFLYYWSPAILAEFLDPKISNLEIVRKEKSFFQDLFIAKYYESVMVGTIDSHTTMAASC